MIDAAGIRVNLIERLIPIFGKPKSVDGLADVLADAVPNYADETAMKNLATNLIATRKAKGFPSASELIGAVKAIPRADGTSGERVYRTSAEQERLNKYDEAERRAHSFLKGTEIARRAIREKWGPGLIDFAIVNGRAPDAAEEVKVRAKSLANNAVAREFEGKMAPAIRGLRASMHDHAARSLGIEATP